MEPIRVTQVLDFFKEQWYIDWVHKVGKAQANKIGKAAMKIGSRVDEIIKKECVESSHIQTQYHKEKQEVQNCLIAYRKWADIYKPKSITPCTRLNATIDGLEVTGEPDLIVDDVLVDIKCAGKISPKYWVQVNMYRYLQDPFNSFREPRGKVGILRLDKTTGSYEYVVKDFDYSLVVVWLGLAKAMVYFKGDEDGTEL